MTHSISRLWREPLVHFLVIGAVLFLYYDLVGRGESEAPVAKRIVVSSGQVEQRVSSFERARLRPPTPLEFDALVESHVRVEVFYREAFAMGLDQDDQVLSRRMRRKLEFMLEDLSGIAAFWLIECLAGF